MERDLNKFDKKEKLAFDKAFPQEEIDAFIKEGADPVEVFKALKTFNFPDVREDAKDIVLAHFSNSRFAPQIHMHDNDQTGEVMVYRRNIVPLLRASLEVYTLIFDLFTDDVKASINQIVSGQQNAERDWQK